MFAECPWVSGTLTGAVLGNDPAPLRPHYRQARRYSVYAAVGLLVFGPP